MKKREMVQRIAADTEITHIQADAAVEAILTAIKLVFRTLYRGFCLLRTEYGFCGLPASLSATAAMDMGSPRLALNRADDELGVTR
jgi:hypothetical protein